MPEGLRDECASSLFVMFKDSAKDVMSTERF